MRIFYANNKYSKYGVEGFAYVNAILAASFYILITLMVINSVVDCFYPKIDTFIFDGTNKIYGVLYLLISCFLVRVIIKEKDINQTTLTEKQVKRRVYYLIAFIMLELFIIGFLGLKVEPLLNR
jgi:hypothetical protein